MKWIALLLIIAGLAALYRAWVGTTNINSDTFGDVIVFGGVGAILVGIGVVIFGVLLFMVV